ncbi:MAG: dephospho-CoA kinase [Alkaliphilus sp.]|nr:dephospho-CoA kinase [Alkaliphilus sp.]
MVRVIGLTGGIASGKTTISNILKELGAIIIDADKIARKVVERGSPALKEIEEHFGSEILFENMRLNRKKLGNIVFNDTESLKKLNEIVHPYIVEKIIDEINRYRETYNNRVIILDAALLIELNLMNLVEEVWLIVVPEKMQLERLVERENISTDQAQKRIDVQIALEDKKKYADLIIDNSKDLAYLQAQIEENWERIIE